MTVTVRHPTPQNPPPFHWTNKTTGYPAQAPSEGYTQQAYGQQSYGSHEGYQQPSYGEQHGYAPPETELLPGWIKQWDGNSQRYYYVETATGRTQWDPPHGYGHDENRGGFGGSHDGYGLGSYGQDSHGHDSYGHSGHGYSEYNSEHQKEKDGHGGMVAAGVGGLAVGAVGGAVIAHEMST